jgi:hypothetical protein
MVMTIAVCRVCESQVQSIAHLSYQQKRGRDDRKWYYFNIATDPATAGGLFGMAWKSLQRHGWKAQGHTLQCPCY